ncbi:glycosyltransferase [Gloeocapsopsis dulcis]|uniref:Glycosyl transferase family 2 n=1 Tax=Gloeocapsopsis dulcis AAB1 = 1H9 TaxID=1433147 RepID=A0A6N8G1H7_9CHRO|nr:glycosyltransferase [Gloeocapsopsis dulcis]MUL38742.1 glycosyl transferase family 2 [Gloeocapsopsis dulcis AAB1 = 1H9]WNN91655.1 glycosyltransferase [Gloeocapsopsis dulcis]
MNSKPLVSAIVIFLNAEKFIQEAIESIFAQTYDHWELLLVDDGSSDSSTAIARCYATKHPEKVRYLEHDGHQNHGMSATRNLGIRNAKGKYIAFLDADDVWLPHKLEQQVAILESQPEAAMVYGSTQYWYSWTEKPEDIQRDSVPDLGVQVNTLFKPPTLLTACYPLGKASAPCPSDLLLRREMVERIGGFEEDFRGMYQMYEDQAFLTKVYLKESVFVASECWDRYRLHPDSCSSMVTKAGQYHSVRLVFLNWLAKYLSEQGVKDNKIWQALRKALWPYRHPRLYRLLELAQHFVKHMKEVTEADKAAQMKELLKSIGRRTLSVQVRRWLRVQQQSHEYCPPVGWVRFGNLRRVTPISREFGFDRGLPVDRYYIENFLARYANDIRGRVLEIGDNSYTRKFGGDRVTKSDVLHVAETNSEATIFADLTCAEHIPSDTFDCFILTQTLHLIYDVRAALKTLYRILKPGGVVLATFPGISQISNDEWGDSWYWSFTSLSAQRLFEEVFSSANVKVETHGNVLAATAFLQGLATEELRQEELDYRDRSYEVIITVRAMKPEVA